MRKLNNILVTGGARFIGVNFIRFLLGEGRTESELERRVIKIDELTYAGNAANLTEVEKSSGKDSSF